MDSEHVLKGADPTILLTFDYKESKWVLVVTSVLEVRGEDCPEEVKAEWESQHGYPMPDDEVVQGAQIGGTKFDSIEEMQAWLTLNLHKMWGWMIGLEPEPPYEEFVRPNTQAL